LDIPGQQRHASRQRPARHPASPHGPRPSDAAGTTFADGGYTNITRTMKLKFDYTVRLTGPLLPILRAGAPSAIVNLASTTARGARPGATR